MVVVRSVEAAEQCSAVHSRAEPLIVEPPLV